MALLNRRALASTKKGVHDHARLTRMRPRILMLSFFITSLAAGCQGDDTPPEAQDAGQSLDSGKPSDAPADDRLSSSEDRSQIVLDAPDSRFDVSLDAGGEPADISPDGSGIPDSSIDQSGMNDVDGSGAPSLSLTCNGCPVGYAGIGHGCVWLDSPAAGCAAGSLFPKPACVFQHGIAGCSGTSCVLVGCRTDWADCDNDPSNGCEANLSEPAHCGSCPNTCQPGQVCTPTGCAATCTPPLTNCSGACVNLTTSTSFCGSCSSQYESLQFGYSPTCTGGGGCDPGLTLCGSCVDAQRNPDNCGGCGIVCPAREVGRALCLDGRCVPCGPGFTAVNIPGFTPVNNSCIDLKRDVNSREDRRDAGAARNGPTRCSAPGHRCDRRLLHRYARRRRHEGIKIGWLSCTASERGNRAGGHCR